MKKRNSKKSWIHFFNLKPVKILVILILILLPVLTFIPLAIVSNHDYNVKNNQQNNLTTSANRCSSVKAETHDYWHELEVNKIEFKTLMEVHVPNPTNLQDLFAWAEENYELPSSVQLPHSVIFDYQTDPLHQSQPGLFDFDWSSVGYATTGQFKLFLQFYGKPVEDPVTHETVSGLSKFTSATFVDTDIEFNLPEFWLSLRHYMPNLKTIKIKSNENDHRSLTALPKEIGENEFNVIEIYGENIQDNYENFLGWKDDAHTQPYPLVDKLTHLIIQNSNIQDHLVLDPNNKDDKIRYFTEQVFENYSKLKHLQWLDLSGNRLEHVKGNLVCLPGIIELHLQNNEISDWHCVDANGSEGTWNESKTEFTRVSGLGQLCFPNPKHISFVDISGNQLSQLVRISHNEWTNTSLAKYVQTQKDLYPSLNFVNLANQIVDKRVFIFGNNIGANESDMNIDLTNIFVIPNDLTSIDEEVQYISTCLKDRMNKILDEKGEKRVLENGIWDSLSLTQNAAPTIIDLYGQFSNYVNYYDNQERTDVVLDSDKNKIYSDDEQETNYYSQSTKSEYKSHTESARYLSTQTHNTIEKNKHEIGMNVLRMQTKPGVDPTSEFSGHPKGVAQDYDSSVQHSIDINPHYYIPPQMSPLSGLQTSKYHYDVQIFNAEQFVFYLTNITDEAGKPVITDYIKSISDKDPSVDDIYKNFWNIFSYSGNNEKKLWFQDNFNDREFWNINFAVNNKEARVMTVSVTYPVYQYIGSTDASVKPTKLTFNIKIPMNPFFDNKLQKILTVVWVVELIAFVLLLIPLFVYWSRMRIKTKAIKDKKQKAIAELINKDAPKVKITEHPTVEKKMSSKEYLEQLKKTGNASKTKTVIVPDKDIKPSKTGEKAIDIDSILEEIE